MKEYIPEPSLEPPEEEPMPRCPRCGEETDILYEDKAGDIVGCDNCIYPLNAWLWGVYAQ